MRLALFQMSADPDPVTNPDRIVEAMGQAKSEGADMLVTPELALSGYGLGDRVRDVAQPADGPWADLLRAAAQDIGIRVVAGFPERLGANFYISAMSISPDPEESMHVYRKTFLYGSYEKQVFTSHSPSSDMIEHDGITTGFLICYDVEFPETTRRLAQAGAELVVVPTATPRGSSGLHVSSKVISVRAFENQIFVAYANYVGADNEFSYQGQSSIAAPDGTISARANDREEEIIFANIDPRDFDRSRNENPYLQDLSQRFYVPH